MIHAPGGHQPLLDTGTAVYAPLLRLIRLFDRRRRVQFVFVFALTLVGAVAELVSIGAVIPFLQVVAAPESLARWPAGMRAMRWLGITEPGGLLIPAAILLIVTAIGSAVVRLILTWVTGRFVYGLTHDLSLVLFERLIRQPYASVIRRNSAELLSGIEKVTYIGTGILSPLLLALSSATISIGVIALLLIVSPGVALLAGLSVGLIYTVIGLATRRSLMRIGNNQAALATQRIKLAQESLGGIRDIILDRSHDVFAWQFRVTDARLRRLQATTTVISLAPRYVVECAGIVVIAASALYYAGQPGGVVQAIPVLGALALAAQRLLPLAHTVNLAFVQYTSSVGMLTDIFRLMDDSVAPLPRRQGDDGRRLADAIAVENVSFTYGGKPALSDVSLAIPRGARIGIIGRTGSGKSTLVDLLMGLLSPTAGRILIDGRPLDDAGMAAWQMQVAHVPQSIFLLDATIAENIAFGVPGERIDMDRVGEAARRAQASEFIVALPNRYDTVVGERGVRLSGGQRQRLGIARALYKRAAVLVLDEATSALDTETERSVMDGIRQLDRDLTVIMIAHRLSTVRACDVIARLEGGRIAALGTFDQVVDARHRSD